MAWVSLAVSALRSVSISSRKPAFSSLAAAESCSCRPASWVSSAAGSCSAALSWRAEFSAMAGRLETAMLICSAEADTVRARASIWLVRS